MVDITSIQTFPVAPALSVLQTANNSINIRNKNLQIALTLFVIAGGTFITYHLIKKYNESRNAENQSPRN